MSVHYSASIALMAARRTMHLPSITALSYHYVCITLPLVAEICMADCATKTSTQVALTEHTLARCDDA
jgi:hypothetical protein